MSEWGWYPVPPPDPEEQLLRDVRQGAHQAAIDGLTWAQTLSQTDRAMVAKAVDFAWQAFKDAVAVLPKPEPKGWVAHILAVDWVNLPLQERAQLGARPLHAGSGDVILVQGVGAPPSIVERWAFVR